jgi:hypothetical protein
MARLSREKFDVVCLANRRSNPLIADFIDMAKEILHEG